MVNTIILTALMLLSSGEADTAMKCGSGVNLCGVISLESGFGSGNYNHPLPAVHGLWPATGTFGDSDCVAPGDVSARERPDFPGLKMLLPSKRAARLTAPCSLLLLALSLATQTSPPKAVPGCYDSKADLGFVQHEWSKHGICSGTKDSADFFAQVCALVAKPLSVMNASRSGGGKLDDMASALKNSGIAVFQKDSESSPNNELQISACARNGTWVLAAVSEFGTKCGGGGPSPPPPPAPPSGGSCAPGKKGPACSRDGDCVGVPDCVRCAHSGFCTSVPARL